MENKNHSSLETESQTRYYFKNLQQIYFKGKPLRYNEFIFLHSNLAIPVVGLKSVKCTEKNIFYNTREGIFITVEHSGAFQEIHVLPREYRLCDCSRDYILVENSIDSILYVISEKSITQCLDKKNKNVFGRVIETDVSCYTEIKNTAIPLPYYFSDTYDLQYNCKTFLIGHQIILVHDFFIDICDIDIKLRSSVKMCHKIILATKVVERCLEYLFISLSNKENYYFVEDRFIEFSDCFRYATAKQIIELQNFKQDVLDLALSEIPSKSHFSSKYQIKNYHFGFFGPSVSYTRNFHYHPSLIDISNNVVYKVIRKILGIDNTADNITLDESVPFPCRINADDKHFDVISSIPYMYHEIYKNNVFRSSAVIPVSSSPNMYIYTTNLFAINITPLLFTNTFIDESLFPAFKDSEFLQLLNLDELFFTIFDQKILKHIKDIEKSCDDVQMIVLLGTMFKMYLREARICDETTRVFLQHGVINEELQKYFLFVLSITPSSITNLIEKFLCENLLNCKEGSCNISIVSLSIKFLSSGNANIISYLLNVFHCKEIFTEYKNPKLLIAIAIFLIASKNTFHGFECDNTLANYFITQQGNKYTNVYSSNQEKFYSRLFYNLYTKQPIEDSFSMDDQVSAADVFYILLKISLNVEDYTVSDIQSVVSKLKTRISSIDEYKNPLIFNYFMITASFLTKIFGLDPLFFIRILRRKLKEGENDRYIISHVGKQGLSTINACGFESLSIYKNLFCLLTTHVKLKMSKNFFKLLIVAFFYSETPLPEITELEFFKYFCFSQLFEKRQQALSCGVELPYLKKVFSNELEENLDKKYFIDVLTDFLENHTEEFYNQRNKKYFIDDDSLEFIINALN